MQLISVLNVTSLSLFVLVGMTTCNSVHTRNRGGMIRTRDTDLTTEQVQVIRHTFDTFDPAHKSYLPYDTVEYMVRIMRVATGKDLQFIVANADTNGDQRIQFDEFLALAERFLIEEGPDVVAQDLRQAFDTYNTDSDGMISDADMKEILRAMDVELTADELDVLVDQLDRDGSGSVHFNEFIGQITGLGD